jgi:flagellar protein FliO/FliZ
MGLDEIFLAILAFLAVLALLLITTRILTYKSKKMMSGNYMKIVESLSLGVNNRIHLIKVDNEFFIVSATNKHINFLSKVDINNYAEEEIKSPIPDMNDFKAVLKKYVTGNFSSKVKKDADILSDNDSEIRPQSVNEFENNEMTFKNNLEKLKHLSKTINDQRSQNE